MTSTLDTTSATRSPQDEAQTMHCVDDRSSLDHPVADDAEDSTPRGLGRLRGLGALDLFLLAALFLLPCVFLPVFNSWYWTPRVMILIIAIPPGAFALVSLLRNRDRSAVLAAAAIVWSLIGALTSESVSGALHGVIGQDASVLTYSGAIALWALSRFSSGRARGLVVPVLMTSLGVNLIVGYAQVLLSLEQGDLRLQAARAVGLTPNAVYFGALMAAGSALAVWQAKHASLRRSAWWCGAALMFGSAVSFSGSRVAAGAMVVVGVALVITAGRRRLALIGLSASVLGMVAGSALARLLDLDSDSVSRLSQTGSGGRVGYWRVALDAIAERPVQGWGLGQFRAAVQGRLSLDALVPFGDAQPFWDAHNVFIGLAVAVGVPGMILFLGFAWVAGRRMSASLVPAVAAVAITWMLQPGGLTTLPLVVMLLGLSADSRLDRNGPVPIVDRAAVPRWARIGGVAAVSTGVLAALWLGVADARLELAVQSGDTTAARAAASMFGSDPVANDVVAKMLEIDGSETTAQQAAILDAFERNTREEPGRAFWWIELARRQGQFGDPEAAHVSTRRALEIEPFNKNAWMIMDLVARDLDDEDLEREALEVLCVFGVEGTCDRVQSQSE